MGIPLRQSLAILSYILKQRLRGVERYPLVLMLEPLFRCNLACAVREDDYPKKSWIVVWPGRMHGRHRRVWGTGCLIARANLIHKEMPRSSVALFSARSLSTYARTLYSFLDT
jgi:hypothetical protein